MAETRTTPTKKRKAKPVDLRPSTRLMKQYVTEVQETKSLVPSPAVISQYAADLQEIRSKRKRTTQWKRPAPSPFSIWRAYDQKTQAYMYKVMKLNTRTGKYNCVKKFFGPSDSASYQAARELVAELTKQSVKHHFEIVR